MIMGLPLETGTARGGKGLAIVPILDDIYLV